MKLRTLLTTTGAGLASVVLAMAPAAYAAAPHGPIADVKVGTSSANVAHPITGVLKNASVTIGVYGVPTKLNCTSGTAGGVVNGGTTGLDPAAAFSFDELSLNCDSFLSGDTVTMALTNCNVDVVMTDDQVHDGLVDSGGTATDDPNYVSGLANMSQGATNCVQITTGTGCKVDVGGTVETRFHEAEKVVGGVSYQDLQLTGGGLETRGPNWLCLGAVGNPGGFTLEATFNIQSPDGLIDFRP